jgi:hypothetical protein
MDNGHELVAQTETAYDELREALEGLPEARMTDAWLGTWSVREILIHMSGWHREMIPALARIARGEAPYPDGAYDDFDAWNARFVEARRGAKVADVLAELAASHRDFVVSATALADEHLAPGGRARSLVEGSGAEHYREHAAQIRRWRATHAA